MLGLPDTGAQALLNATFGPGVGPVWLTSLRCWGYESSLTNCMAPFSTDSGCTHARVLVIVGRYLLPYATTWTGVKAQLRVNADEDWGFDVSHQQHVLIRDSLFQDLPLSNAAWLILTNNTNVEFQNVTMRRLRGGGQSLLMPIAGPVLAVNITSMTLRDVTCTGVRGAAGWSCMLVMFETARVPDRSLQLEMVNVTMTDNAVTRMGYYFATLGPTRENLGRYVGMGCLVLASGCPECNWAWEDVWGTYDAGGSQVSVLMRDVLVANNTGGMGVGVSSLDLPVVSGLVWWRRWGAIWLWAPVGSLSLANSTIRGNTAAYSAGGIMLTYGADVITLVGGAIYANRSIGRLELRGSSFEGNAASWGGGAVAVTEAGIGALLLLEGSRMIGNTALLKGGAVSAAVDIANGGALHAEKGLGRLLLRGGSRIRSNSASDGGGCVAVPGGAVASVVLEGGSALSGCVTQSGDGGALLAATGVRELLLSGGSEMSGNVVRDGNGGAVGVRRGDISRISVSGGSRICDNSAPSGSGGALWLGAGSIPSATVEGQGTAICNNTAGLNGGGIAVTNLGIFGGAFSALSLTDGAVVCNNTAASGSGGGVWAAGGSVAVVLDGDGSAISGNAASVSGGGLWFGGSVGSVACRNGSRMGSNRVGGGAGGALYIKGSLGSLVLDSRGALHDNAALASDGGAAWVGGAINAVDMGGGCSVTSNTAAAGSGGVVYAPEGVKSVRIGGGCRLEGNTAGVNGGLMELRQLPTLLAVEGGAVVANNTALRGDGGAFRIRADGSRPASNMTLRLSGCTLDSNRAGLSGGAIFLAPDGASGGDASGSSNAGASSAAASNTTATSSARPANISTAAGASGAAMVWSVLIRNASLTRNTAGWAGGAIAASAARRTALLVRLSGSDVAGNRAGDGTSSVESVWRDGGALALTGTTAATGAWLDAGGGTSSSDSGSGSGSAGVDVEAVWRAAAATAAVAPGSCSVMLEGSTFRSSFSGGSGGAVLLSTCQALLWRCSFASCQALQAGGAVAATGPASLPSALQTPPPPPPPVSSASPPPAAETAVVGSGGSDGASILAQPPPQPQQLPPPHTQANASDVDSSIRSYPLSWRALLVVGCTFSGNVASQANGGALAASTGGAVRLVDCDMSSNRAAVDGGAVASLPPMTTAAASGSSAGALQSLSPATSTATGAAAGDGGGLLELEFCRLRSNEAMAGSGGALFMSAAAPLRLVRSELAGNSAASSGGGAAVMPAAADSTSWVYMYDTLVSSNSASVSGGGVFLSTAARARLVTVRLTNNSAGLNGGGLASQPPPARQQLPAVANSSSSCSLGPLELVGCNISANAADASGGGAYVQLLEACTSGVRMRRVVYTANVAGQLGGGAAVVSAGVGTRSSSTLVVCAAEQQQTLGGPAALGEHASEGGTSSGALAGAAAAGVLIDGGAFVSNQADTAGGGLYLATACSLHMRGTVLESNFAQQTGGGLAQALPAAAGSTRAFLAVVTSAAYVTGAGSGASAVGGSLGATISGSLVLEAVAVSGNVVRGSGGGVHVATHSNVRVTESTFTRNSADQQGGAFAAVQPVRGTMAAADAVTAVLGDDDSAEVEFRSSTFDGNHAGGGSGGAIYSSRSGGAAVHLHDSRFTTNSAAQSGGAVSIIPAVDSSSAGDADGAILQLGELLVTGCNLTANAARRFGGAVFVASGVAASIWGSHLTANLAGQDGGGLAVLLTAEATEAGAAVGQQPAAVRSSASGVGAMQAAAAPLEVRECRFESNQASGSGGALVWAAPGRMSMTDSAFSANMVTEGSGGGVAALPPDHYVRAYLKGSAAAGHGTATLDVRRCQFNRNWASEHAGGMLIMLSYSGPANRSAAFAAAEVSDCSFRDGVAGSAGGGLSVLCPLELCGSSDTPLLRRRRLQGSEAGAPFVAFVRLRNLELLSNTVTGTAGVAGSGSASAGSAATAATGASSLAVALRGGIAAAGGGAAIDGVLRAALRNVTAVNNTVALPAAAAAAVGAGGGGSSVGQQGASSAVSSADLGGGGGLYVGAGSAAAIDSCHFNGNRVLGSTGSSGSSRLPGHGGGGGILASNCSALLLTSTEVLGGASLGAAGGGILTDGCWVVAALGGRLAGNAAAAGGGIYISGLPAPEPATAVAGGAWHMGTAGGTLALLHGITIRGNTAGLSAAGRSSTGDAGSSSTSTSSYEGYGGGLMVAGSQQSATGSGAGSSATARSVVPQLWMLDAYAQALWPSCDPVAAMGALTSDVGSGGGGKMQLPSAEDAGAVLRMLRARGVPVGAALEAFSAGSTAAGASQIGSQAVGSNITAGSGLPQLLLNLAMCRLPAMPTADSGVGSEQLMSELLQPLLQDSDSGNTSGSSGGLDYLRLSPASFRITAIRYYDSNLPSSQQSATSPAGDASSAPVEAYAAAASSSSTNSATQGLVLPTGKDIGGLPVAYARHWALTSGVKLQVQVELVNGLGLRVPEDGAWTVTAQLSIQPVNNATAKGPASTPPGDVLLSPAAAAGSGTAASGGLSEGAAAAADASSLLAVGGGEGVAAAILESRQLEVAVRGGVAEWDQVVASGWPGEYELVVSAVAWTGVGVQVAPLRQPVLLLPWPTSGNSGVVAAPWPSAYKLAWVREATAAAAQCRNCPDNTICPGGAMMVPQPGYWHSAANSTAVHRCPKPQACRWPDSDAPASSTSISFGSFLRFTLNSPTAAAEAVMGLNTSSAAGSAAAAAADRRSRVLLQCQQKWYASRPAGGPALAALEAAAALAAGSNSSSAAAVELESTCFLWGLPEADPRSYMQLQCAPGYTGPLCGACQPGYFLTSDLSCSQCLSVAATAVLVTLAMLANAALILYTAVTNLSDGGTYAARHPNKVTAADVLKVAIVHMQYFIIISRLNIDWPDVILRFQGTLAAATGAQGKFLSSPSCLNPEAGPKEQAQAYLLSSLATPLVVIALVSGLWVCRYLLGRRAVRSDGGGPGGRSLSKRDADLSGASSSLKWRLRNLLWRRNRRQARSALRHASPAGADAASSPGHSSAAGVRKRLALLAGRISLPQPPPSVAAAAELTSAASTARGSNGWALAAGLGSAGAGPQPFGTTQLGFTLSSRLSTASSAAVPQRRLPQQHQHQQQQPSGALPLEALSATASLLLPRMSFANAASASELVDFADVLEDPSGGSGGEGDDGDRERASPMITLDGGAATGDSMPRAGCRLAPETTAPGLLASGDSLKLPTAVASLHASRLRQQALRRSKTTESFRPRRAALQSPFHPQQQEAPLQPAAHSVRLLLGDVPQHVASAAAAAGLFGSAKLVHLPASASLPLASGRMRPKAKGDAGSAWPAVAALEQEGSQHGGRLQLRHSRMGGKAVGSVPPLGTAASGHACIHSPGAPRDRDATAFASWHEKGEDADPPPDAQPPPVPADLTMAFGVPVPGDGSGGVMAFVGAGRDAAASEEALPELDVISPGDVYLIRKGATEAIVAAGMLPGAGGGIGGGEGAKEGGGGMGAAVRNLAKSVTLDGMASAATLGEVDVAIGLPSQLRLVVTTALTVLYAGWSQAALSVFACRTIDDAGGSGPFAELQRATWPYGNWMRDLTQQCYAGPHAAVYMPIGIAAVLLVCVAPPLASFVMLWRVRHKLDEPRTQAKYGFLFLRYKRRFYFWDPVVQLQTLSLVAVDVFGRGLPVLQQSLLLLLGFNIIAAINMTAAPAHCRLLLVLEFLSLGVLSGTVTLGLFFVEPSQAPTGSDGAAIGAVILLLNSALLFAMLLMLLGNYRHTAAERCRVWWGGLQRALQALAADARAQRRRVLQQRQMGRGSGTSRVSTELSDGLGHQLSQPPAPAGHAVSDRSSAEGPGYYRVSSLVRDGSHSAEVAGLHSSSGPVAVAQWLAAGGVPQPQPLPQQQRTAAARWPNPWDAASPGLAARADSAVVDFSTDAEGE
ncbi:hypothetical protein HXX76_014493 [Chlamydomonas incerta]|uniref:SRCR domain-containing protein n=1 Tax=Chlamydomonas incerta TaxID=51695 RepID=A0A835SPI1_CHLIN|nr:hypothetical protein HXX76_014493 [Chlamydomonas incerta]|eukprot:KAG2424440.1 hypothetical protein HXX76_014493 [Chlamydomonas incerta]